MTGSFSSYNNKLILPQMPISKKASQFHNLVWIQVQLRNILAYVDDEGIKAFSKHKHLAADVVLVVVAAVIGVVLVVVAAVEEKAGGVDKNILVELLSMFKKLFFLRN